MVRFQSLILLGLCLLGSFSSEAKENLGLNDVDTIVGHVLTLKESVDASAKEQWEALQSLRFHMLSARTGLKQALEEIEALKLQVAECRTAAPAGHGDTEHDDDDDDDDEEEEPEVPTTTPSASPSCRWPSEEVSGRCLVLVTDQLLNWEAAQQHCRSIGGSLAGKVNFSNLQDYLTGHLGIDSELRVRWAVWAGAQQTLNGWEWASQQCSSDSVDAEVWSSGQPRAATPPPDLALACMSLDGFDDYRGVSAPCSALRRFVCDVTEGGSSQDIQITTLNYDRFG